MKEGDMDGPAEVLLHRMCQDGRIEHLMLAIQKGHPKATEDEWDEILLAAYNQYVTHIVDTWFWQCVLEDTATILRKGDGVEIIPEREWTP